MDTFGILPTIDATGPKWLEVLGGDQEKRWLRADTGGLVDMHWGLYPLVHAGDPICTVIDHFKGDSQVVTASFTGLIVGILESPVALPGHSICHLARVDHETRDEIEREIATGEFDGDRPNAYRWMGDEEE